jgi:tetratricopeptide (TPR) repeat protein
MRLSKNCAVELCKTLTAAAMWGGSALVNPASTLGMVQTATGLAGLWGTLNREQASKIEKVVAQMAAQVERESETWIGARGPGAAARREDALPAIERMLAVIEPSAAELVELNLDRVRVVAFYLKRAAERESAFSDAPENEIARELLSDVVGYTFDIFRQLPEVQSQALAGLLVRTERIETKIDLLPDEIVRKVVAALQPKTTQNAHRQGLERETILILARRLRPDENLSFDQAVHELEHAVAVALDVMAQGERGSNLGAFVDAILARVAEETKKGAFDKALSEVDGALDELVLRETEQRAEIQRGRIALIETGIQQEILRRDAAGAARRIEMLVALQTDKRPVALTEESYRQLHTYYDEGDLRGINFSLEIAIQLALAMVHAATTPAAKGYAYGNLGNVLQALGERESSTVRLHEAVTAFREVLKEYTREHMPLDWATTQNNLGNALLALGKRESSTARLDEAVTAFREALKEYTRERVPLDWATTQNNLGNTLATLGMRETGTAKLKEAVTAFREAMKEWTRERVPLRWAMTQNNLGNALWALGQRKNGTERLEEAVTAYREALKERTRERAPLDWATTQNNLGTALQTLGQREAGTARLEEAVTAYREALKERTRERVPPDWAMTQNNLGNAFLALSQRESSTTRLEEALAAYRAALAEYQKAGATYYIEVVAQNLTKAEKLLAERRKRGGKLIPFPSGPGPATTLGIPRKL